MGRAGPKRDIVVANAAAALVAAARAEGFQEAAGIAAESIDSGAAQRLLGGLAIKLADPSLTLRAPVDRAVACALGSVRARSLSRR